MWVVQGWLRPELLLNFETEGLCPIFDELAKFRGSDRAQRQWGNIVVGGQAKDVHDFACVIDHPGEVGSGPCILLVPDQSAKRSDEEADRSYRGRVGQQVNILGCRSMPYSVCIRRFCIGRF